MKKVLFALLCLGVSSGVFAQLPPFSAGVGMGFGLLSDTQSFDYPGYVGTSSTGSYLLTVETYFDATYLEAKAQYSVMLGQGKNTLKRTTPANLPDQTSDIDSKLSFLNLSVAGKYPIRLALGVVIFPLLGLEYDLNLTANNMSSQQKSDLNDLYVIAGLGADIYMTPSVFFRPLVTFGFNTTAAPTNTSSGYTYSGYKADLGISVGFVL